MRIKAAVMMLVGAMVLALASTDVALADEAAGGGNMVSFRGGWAGLTSNRANELFTDVHGTGQALGVSGNNDGKSGYYVGGALDLLKAMTDGKDLRKVTAGDMMTPEEELVTVTENTSVMDLVKILQESHLIRVPVVKDKTLVGIVARRDIVFGYVRAVAFYWP